MEVPGPGEFSKATRPLEASIKLCPSAVLTNSLPYFMEVGQIHTCNDVFMMCMVRACKLMTGSHGAAPACMGLHALCCLHARSCMIACSLAQGRMCACTRVPQDFLCEQVMCCGVAFTPELFFLMRPTRPPSLPHPPAGLPGVGTVAWRKGRPA